MFAVLGPVEFDMIPGLEEMEQQFGMEYAEHALFGRKPRLQFVGEKLDEVRLTMLFHFSFCDPEAELEELKDAMTAREVLPLVFGAGDYAGRFVLTSLTVTAKHNAPDGTPLIIGVQASLREFTGDPAQSPPPAVIQAGGAMPASGRLIASMPTAAMSPLASLGKAVTAAKCALVLAANAAVAVRSIRAIASHDPVAALARLPAAMRLAGAAWPALGSASYLTGRQTFSGISADTAIVSSNTGLMRSDMRMLSVGLSGVTSANLLSSLAAADAIVNRSDSLRQSTTLPLARMAARSAIRMT
ncbi:MAG: phage tail protein [Burkholderiaceae bacterium]|nr:phage tail protein [Burkholderiaceae bacterium]